MNILQSFLIGLLAISVCLAQNSTNNSTVKDADGNIYTTVKIGNQTWTVENLRTTKYNDGTSVKHIPDDESWTGTQNSEYGAYCYYNNMTDADSIKKYGALYNWYAVNTNKLAPKGWHVPSDADWETLKDFLIKGGYNWDGTTDSNKIAKSLAAKTDWIRIEDEMSGSNNEGSIGNDLTKNNRSGFSALPGGWRHSSADFTNKGTFADWWTSTAVDQSGATNRSLVSSYSFLTGFRYKFSCGFSVRLVKDN